MCWNYTILGVLIFFMDYYLINNASNPYSMTLDQSVDGFLDIRIEIMSKSRPEKIKITQTSAN